MGTIQEPNPDREWLKRSYVDTSTNPYSIDSQNAMIGRFAEGTGGGPVTRRVTRVIGVVALVTVAVMVVVSLLVG